MLYQPTNITPDARSGLGNGVVDAASGMTVTWQVNGDSPMTSFRIVIYQNNAASTEVFDTEVRTDDCPFYGADGNGTPIPFSHYISAGALAGAGITNGGQYKFLITQYYGTNSSVTQASASAFITRATPTVALTDLPETTDRRTLTVNAEYTQAQGDELNWVRWQAALADDTDDPFYDTGYIYGTGILQTTVDGLLNDRTYAVKCSIQTKYGVEADTGWQTVDVSYTEQTLRGLVEAESVRGVNGLQVRWSRATYYGFSPNATNYEVLDGELRIGSGNGVSWLDGENNAYQFGIPWTFVYSGTLMGEDVQLFRVYMHANSLYDRSGSFRCSYDADEQTVTVYYYESNETTDPELLLTVEGVPSYAGVRVVIDPYTVRCTVTQRVDEQYPADDLYAAEDLYPDNGSPEVVATGSADIPDGIEQNYISVVSLHGPQTTDYYWVTAYGSDEEDIETVLSGADYDPYWTLDTYLLADFAGGSTDAGSVTESENSAEIGGYFLYRAVTGGTTLEKVAHVDYDTRGLIDYGARVGVGYTYYVYPADDVNYPISPIQSDCATNCDWNWTVLACTKQSDEEYTVDAAYNFGKNLTTGGIENNNRPGVMENFTRYPVVQPSNALYLSGTLESLIGVIDTTTGQYSDTRTLRDAIYELSVTTKTLFLKSRKGDIMEIRPSDAITMTTSDNVRGQNQKVSFPWVQVGSAEGVSIWSAVES